MPRYSNVTPVFNPISYAERIAPLEEYQKEYDKQMDAIDEQGILADTIGGLIDREVDADKPLADKYDTFSNTLSEVTSELLRTGKLGSTRRTLNNLRRSYIKDLLPIQTAYNDRAADAKAFRDAKLKDQSLIGTDPLTHSLSDYMNGKNPDDKTISGNTLYAMGLADSKAASGREFRETAWRLDQNLGGQFFSRVQREGWNQNEVAAALRAMTQDKNSQISSDARKLLNYLNDARKRIHDLSGVDDLKDKSMISEADNYILEGLITGIGYKQTDDQKAYNPDFGGNGQKPPFGGDHVPFGIREKVIVNGKVKELTDVLQTLSDFREGKITMDSATGKVDVSYDVPNAESMRPTASGRIDYNTTARQITYGEELYDLAKSQKLIPENTSYEEFRNKFINASPEELVATIDDISSKIKSNAQKYGEYYSNFVDSEYVAKSINDYNTGFIQKRGLQGSVIKNAKGKPVDKLPEQGVFNLRIEPELRNKGLQFVDSDTQKVYYVNPSAFSGAVVQYPVTDGVQNYVTTLTLSEAIKRYYEALDNGDADEAGYLGKSIFYSIETFLSDKSKKQGETLPSSK